MTCITIRVIAAVACATLALALQRPARAAGPDAPAWTKDLVIYEIATKSYTSPNGPGSGTFDSLKGKLSYLEELGITGIWLTGHSLRPAALL